MARKKPPEEHENLERWMVSYSDFVTLLFATFVVLYALSQVDVADFKKLEDSIKNAFSAPSIMEGSEGLMDTSSNDIFDTKSADAMVAPLMMEYISAKYEEQSFQEIEKAIEKMAKAGDIEGVEAIMTDRGLLIRFKDDYMFASGSAILNTRAKRSLDKVGVLIGQKFILHYMRIEGHTDNVPIFSKQFPSNWELSSARASAIVRYMIERFKFMPTLFSAIGYADTRSIESNKTAKGRAANRRVEILILKNKYKNQENPQDNLITSKSKKEQEEMQLQRTQTLERIKNLSDAAKDLAGENKVAEEQAIILNQAYEREAQRISKDLKAIDANKRNEITGESLWLKPRPQKGATIDVEDKFNQLGK